MRSAEGGLVAFKPMYSKNVSFPQDMLVHYGYQNTFFELIKIIHTKLGSQLVKFPDYTLTLLGHSFGGGVQSILAANIASGAFIPKIHPSRVNLVSLGASRIGIKVFN